MKLQLQNQYHQKETNVNEKETRKRKSINEKNSKSTDTQITLPHFNEKDLPLSNDTSLKKNDSISNKDKELEEQPTEEEEDDDNEE